jgi:hypothetical protein
VNSVSLPLRARDFVSGNSSATDSRDAKPYLLIRQIRVTSRPQSSRAKGRHPRGEHYLLR